MCWRLLFVIVLMIYCTRVRTEGEVVAIGAGTGFSYFGAEKCLMPDDYKKFADEIISMEIRPDDVWVMGAPRNGTTWTRAMVWLINNNLDYRTAYEKPLKYRFPWLEKKIFTAKPRTVVTPPRHIFTHLPFSLLPENILDKCKIIFVARNPKDVIVSHYHAAKSFAQLSFTGDFQTFLDLYITDQVPRSNFFPRLKMAWARRNHPNLHFLFYEDMLQDLKATVQRLSNFLGKQYTDEQFKTLCEHLKFDNMKICSTYASYINPGTEDFFRKGKSGEWKEYFDKEMTKKVDKWICDNLAGTSITFPEV